ncbi:hypothetical protein, partial [Ochrobactrum sp. AP1BH01-1]|uniref:hypothetical protein n=1 Tax=Ochrobactrum sp. AP1BH01-1 TaxID=2823874 RepID=UPI001B358DC3
MKSAFTPPLPMNVGIGSCEPPQLSIKELKITIDFDVAPKFYPVLSSLQRFWVAVFGAVAAGCGAEPFLLRSTASRR